MGGIITYHNKYKIIVIGNMKVYKTTNLVNGKIYIGITNGNNKKYLGSGVLLKVDIKKYGKESFIVETLEDNIDIKDIEEKEKEYIKKFNSTDKELGYNIATGGSYRKKVPKRKLSIILKDVYEKNPEKRLLASKKNLGRKMEHSDLRSESLKRYWSDKKKNVIKKKNKKGSEAKIGEKNPMFGRSGNNSPTSIKFTKEEIKFLLNEIKNFTLKQLLQEFKKKFNRKDIKSVKPIRRILRENGV